VLSRTGGSLLVLLGASLVLFTVIRLIPGDPITILLGSANIYDPELVARAILECAEHPHRTVRVGGGAEIFSTTERLAPRLGDKFKEATAFTGQHSDRPPRDDDTLHAPRPGDGRVRGNYPGRVMSRSAYTTMRLNPGKTMLGIAAVGVGLALAFGRRDDDR